MQPVPHSPDPDCPLLRSDTIDNRRRRDVMKHLSRESGAHRCPGGGPDRADPHRRRLAPRVEGSTSRPSRRGRADPAARPPLQPSGSRGLACSEPVWGARYGRAGPISAAPLRCPPERAYPEPSAVQGGRLQAVTRNSLGLPRPKFYDDDGAPIRIGNRISARIAHRSTFTFAVTLGDRCVCTGRIHLGSRHNFERQRWTHVS